METDSDEKQLLNQILNAVKVTPSLNEDLQVEVMKVSLTWEQLCIIGKGARCDPRQYLPSQNCLFIVTAQFGRVYYYPGCSLTKSP